MTVLYFFLGGFIGFLIASILAVSEESEELKALRMKCEALEKEKEYWKTIRRRINGGDKQ